MESSAGTRAGRRRRRAARALAEQRRQRGAHVDPGSPDEEECPGRERGKPPRRRKKEALFEEDVIDGFAILSFKTYEDIEIWGGKVPTRITDSCEKKTKKAVKKTVKANGTLTPGQPPGGEDKENRIKEDVFARGEELKPKSSPVVVSALLQETGPSEENEKKDKKKEVVSSKGPPPLDRLIKREPPDLDDRLSDASSRASSGRGYLCDSEDDDKGSDSGSVLFAASPPRPNQNNERRDDSPERLVVEATVRVVEPQVNGHSGRESPVDLKPGVNHLKPEVTTSLKPRSPSPPPPRHQPQLHVISSASVNSLHQVQQSQPPIQIPGGIAPKTERLSPVPHQAPSPYQTGLGTGLYPPPPSYLTHPHSLPPVSHSSHPSGLPGHPHHPPTSLPSLPQHPVSSHSGHPAVSSHPGLPVSSHHPAYSVSSHLGHQESRPHPQLPPVSHAHLVAGHLPPPDRHPSHVVSSLAQHPAGHPSPHLVTTSPHHPPQHTVSSLSGQRRSQPSPHLSASHQHQHQHQHPGAGHPTPFPPASHPSPYPVTSHPGYSHPHPSGVPVSSHLPPPPVPSSHQQAQPPLYHPPLYAPYSSTPYLPPSSQRVNRSPVTVKVSAGGGSLPAVTTTSSSAGVRDGVAQLVSSARGLSPRGHSPRGHSPTRERDSYSSAVSSLSRGSVGTPVSLSPFHPPPSHHSVSAYSKPSVWLSTSSAVGEVRGSSTTNSVAGRIGHPQAFPAPLFPPAPQPAPPPPVSTATAASANPSSHSALFNPESLFQSRYVCSPDAGDLLRRELDSRFLASSQDRGPYIRTEMHHHQHQHTHVHQHTTPLIPPGPALFTPPIFKELPKPGVVDSPFYRQSVGFAGYPGYSPALLHPTFGPTTPFAPPSHLPPTFTPKQLTEPAKPKTVKSGKWNAMHVRVAWEIYHHQQKGGLQSSESKASSLLKEHASLRPPPAQQHMFGPPFRPPPAFDPPQPSVFPSLSAHPPAPSPAALSFQGGSLFGRYPPGGAHQPSPAFPPLGTFPPPPNPLHDPWARLSSSRVAGFGAGWPVKSEPSAEEKSRERTRRAEEKARRAASQAQQQASSKSSQQRERSPHRVAQEVSGASKDEPPTYLRPPVALRPPHFPVSPWDHHYRYDPLRYNPLMAGGGGLREDEAAKLFYPGLRAKAPSPVHHQPKEESSQSR